MKSSFILVWLLLFALCGFAPAGGAVQQQPKPVRVEGTKVSLVPPPGFVPSERFPGYGLEEAGASILVTELPAPFAAATAAFTDPVALGKKSMKLLARQAVTVNQRAGLLLHYQQTTAGTEFLKWLLALGDETETVLVTATFPKDAERRFSRLLRGSVLSASWDQTHSVAAEEGLNYSLGERGTLRLAKRVGKTLLYTAGAIFPSQSLDAPVFVVSPSFGGARVGDPQAFAKARALKIDSVVGIGVIEPQPVVIDGLSGYEIVTDGKDRETAEPMAVYQVMLFESDEYYLMQGLVSARHAPQHLAAFKAMARSFKRRLPAQP